jgi:hypothetical protein
MYQRVAAASPYTRQARSLAVCLSTRAPKIRSLTVPPRSGRTTLGQMRGRLHPTMPTSRPVLRAWQARGHGLEALTLTWQAWGHGLEALTLTWQAWGHGLEALTLT